MPRFFAQNFDENNPLIDGSDASHIAKSLRMKFGEQLTVCDTKGTDYICEILDVSDVITLKVLEKQSSSSEPSVEVTLFQCVPKGDKLESIIQKSVELGVAKIIPVLSVRCVSRPDSKTAAKKQVRYQKIADSAAGQCGRGILPEVGEMITFSQMKARLKEFDKAIFFYECGGAPLREAMEKTDRKIAIMVGPEGGFDKNEAQEITDAGAVAVGLGKRILRTETAPIAALSGIMLLTGNLE